MFVHVNCSFTILLFNSSLLFPFLSLVRPQFIQHLRKVPIHQILPNSQNADLLLLLFCIHQTPAAAFFLKLMRSEQFLGWRCLNLKTKDPQGTIGFIHPRPPGLSGKFTTTLHAYKLWCPWWPVACQYSCIKEYCCAHPSVAAGDAVSEEQEVVTGCHLTLLHNMIYGCDM